MDADLSDKRHMALGLRRELGLVVLQHLREEGFKETAHSLEQELGLYFDTKHLEELVRCGAWDDAERYLGGFTRVDESPCSARIFLAIRKQKCLEALGRRITSKEAENLVNDLKARASSDEEAAKMVGALAAEMVGASEDFRLASLGARFLPRFGEDLCAIVCVSLMNRQDERLDTASARNAVFLEIKNLIEANPLFKDKLDFPLFKASRLRTLGNQGLNWQHHQCKKPKQSPEMMTLFSDHSCDSSSNGAKSGTEEQKTGAPRTKGGYENIKIWKSAEISDCGHLQALCMPDEATTRSKVVGLLYTTNGTQLLALGSNAAYKLWKCKYSDINPNDKVWLPANKIVMTNDTSNGNPEEASACIAMCETNIIMSASGGKVSCFCANTFKVLSNFIAPLPPPVVTFIAFHPRDSYIVAFGMDDSTIQIYDFNAHQVKLKIRGHRKMITGLAFHQTMNVLVSSGADGQICVWGPGIKGWLRKSRFIQPPVNWSGFLVGHTRVQFRSDSTNCLVVHERQLAIYDWELEHLCLWSPRDTLPAPISSAVYSCDGLLVYAGFCDGAIGIFEARPLSLRCRIASSAYIPHSIFLAGHIYPSVIAAHPSNPNQIAIGMSDGAVHVLEPLD